MRGVPEYFEQFCKIEQISSSGISLLHFGYNVFVYMHIFAAFVLVSSIKAHPFI